MELWVRSQNKTALSKVRDLIIRENQNENNETNYVIQDLYTLGTYKSKERALEVLDEIQERIIELDKAVIYSHVSEEDYLNVYEMPSE